jgi:hypothetical protein
LDLELFLKLLLSLQLYLLLISFPNLVMGT